MCIHAVSLSLLVPGLVDGNSYYYMFSVHVWTTSLHA